jgi:hypothetical protein
MGAVDRKKHDVDVIERVLGSAQETATWSEAPTTRYSVEVPWIGGSMESTVEFTIGLPDEKEHNSDE